MNKPISLRHQAAELKRMADGTWQAIYHGKLQSVAVPVNPKVFANWVTSLVKRGAFDDTDKAA